MTWRVSRVTPPIAAYYTVRALEVDAYLALLAGGAVVGARMLGVIARQRRLDGFTAFLVIFFGIGVLLTFFTGDERFLLVKDSLHTAVAGLLFVGSCLVRRPLTFAGPRSLGRPGYFARAMAAGATGFVVKDAPPERLVEAVRRVHSGPRAVDPDLAAESLASGTSPLTDRERDVLRAARDGGTVAEIAKAVHLTNGTVRNHLSSAIGKTGAATRAEAVRIADDNGWL
jgi:two-component system response regulator DesR